MRRAALPSGDLVIEHARLSGGGSRAALEAGLAHVATGDIAGGEEILLIPNLRARAALSAGRPPGDFGARLTDQLRALRAGAQVDPTGPVSGAAALRFTSRARYAAWLVAAWLEAPVAVDARGGIALPAAGEIRAWLRSEVIAQGRVLVAVSARLRSRQLLARWIARLEPGEVALAAAALETAYAVPLSCSRAVVSPRLAASSGLPKVSGKIALSCDAGRPVHGASRSQPHLVQIWAELVANEPAAQPLDPPRARLLLLLTTLAKQPNLARHLTPAILDQAIAAALPPETRHSVPQSVNVPERAAAEHESTAETRVASITPKSAPEPSDGGPPPDSPSLPPTEAPGTEISSDERELSALLEQTGVADLQLSESLPVASFETGFGGVFFLVNLLLALALYPDFTRPRDRGLDPSPFWLLDRLAQRMFGAAYRRDPLHRWLESVGLPGTLPSRWEVDPQWLRGLPRGGHALRRSQTRSILWDLRGFALVDGPSAGPRARKGWLKRYREFGGLVPRPSLPRRSPPRHRDERWIACLAEFLAVRIALAGEELSLDSLRLPARVEPDEERLEIVFALADLQVELRLAGLDRDPGWLPAEGRALHFRFE
jgi:hypothetical protein